MSRKSLKWIIVLILIPAVLYGGARLAIWYTVKDALDSAKRNMAPVAALEHTRILSPLLGPFGAAGLRIQPHIFKDSITVGSVLVNIQDPVEKYQFLRAAMEDRLPTRFNFSLNRVQVPLDGDIAAWFDDRATATTGGASACQHNAALTMNELKRIGYEELVADFIVDYAYDRREGGVVAYTRMNLENMFQVTIEGKIPPEHVVFDVDRIRGVPKVSDFSITMEDKSWASRFNGHCAITMGITEEEFVARKAGEIEQLLSAAGFEPSSSLMDGLRRFTAGESDLTIRINPRDPVDLSGIDTSRELGFLMESLGFEVLVDGEPIADLGSVMETAPEEEVQARVQPDETYKPTPLPELPQYLQARVRISTVDEKVHEGYLESVGADKLVLTRHLAGGSATFDVPRSEVREVLVLRP